MNESEYMKEARRLLAKVLNAAKTDAILRQIKLLPIAEGALLSHIAKGERNYELIPPSAAEWFASCPAIANQDWRGGWDACRNRARALLDASVAKGEQARNAGVMVVPTEPVREAEIELADMQQNGDADDVLAAQINLEGVRHAALAKTADESGVPAPSYCDPGSGKPCMRPTTAGQQAGGGEDGGCDVDDGGPYNGLADAPIPAEVGRRALEALRSGREYIDAELRQRTSLYEGYGELQASKTRAEREDLAQTDAAITELQQALEKTK